MKLNGLRAQEGGGGGGKRRSKIEVNDLEYVSKKKAKAARKRDAHTTKENIVSDERGKDG